MSLKQTAITEIPEDTARVAKAVFKKGHRYLLLRDAFGELFSSEDLRGLFHAEGRPAIDPARLALSTVIQFAENLSDERMADAVRARIDLKYLLALPLDSAGFDSSVLSEFRSRLIEGHAEQLLFERLLERFRAHGLLSVRGLQRTDATHVLAAVHALNRVNIVGETFRHTLNVLAVAAPAWLAEHGMPEWIRRYSERFNLTSAVPTSSQAKRDALLAEMGADGLFLLQRLSSPGQPAWLWELPAVAVLHQVWLQNFTWAEGGLLRYRSVEDMPPSGQYISSPYDVEARYGVKRGTSWVGYKIHLTEQCEPDLPMLITNVETTPATTPDFNVVERIHQKLSERQRLPARHLMDTGYLSSNHLVTQQHRHAVQLVGPARAPQRWQAWAGKGFTADHFQIDWVGHTMVCPAGKVSARWADAFDHQNLPVIHVKWSKSDCQVCPLKADCTTANRRSVMVQNQERHEALIHWRAWTTTAEFQGLYGKRAGIEGTMSLGVRSFGMRRSRYVGEAKTRLQHLMTAAALNLIRVADHLAGCPRATTRVTAFERILSPAA